MIEPNFYMLYRLLFVYLIIHIVVFVIDVIRKKTTYKTMNKTLYWLLFSPTSVFITIDYVLCAVGVILFIAKYTLIGE